MTTVPVEKQSPPYLNEVFVAIAKFVTWFNSPAPSEILKGVVAYVEVRTASDNRSAAVKWVLERMGARVAEKFSDDVTHVIFKEGKKRTRDKAQKLGVHMVSVLWVDSCKEKQQRVPEREFSANTQRCGTPPPGVRWKKYKSMQPRDFEDEVARSADRCQKRQRRKDKYRQLLQGRESATPFHSPAHVLVVDTQPRSPFRSLDLQTPTVIIPNTPPSMQARLTQLMREREARRRSEAGESSAGTSVHLDIQPLQRALFREKQTSSQEGEADKTPVSRRRSSRLSGRVSREGTSRNRVESRKNSDHMKTEFSSQPSHGSDTTAVSETEQQKSATGDSQSVSSEFGEKDRQESESNPEITPPHLNQPPGKVGQRKRATQQSLPGRLSQTVQNCSQLDKAPSQSRQQTGDKTENSCIDRKARVRSQESRKRSRKDSNRSPEENTDKSSSSGGRKTHSDGHVPRHSNKKGRHSNKDNGENLVSQNRSEPTNSGIPHSKPVIKRRKLLNPSQELHVLSPSPTENTNVPVAGEKRGRKRKSWDIDAVFPSTLPGPKRGRGSSQMNGIQSRRTSSMQGDVSDSERSPSEPPVKGRKKVVAKKRSSVKKSKGGDESVSSLSSTAQTSSILGSSMSMVFNNSSRTSLSMLAPPRNSLAEFQVVKLRVQGKRGTFRGCSSSQASERDPKRMSLHKFRLTCMPSLVMTSLHRQEQDFVIGAVKRLGVFRLEDRVSKHTTHVVCGEARRTLNVLHALARGCWLVSNDWVVRSVEDGHWIKEEEYEMAEDIPMSKEARVAREAEEPGAYQCGLFQSMGSIFVSNACTPPRTQLVKLLQLCGAKVTDSIQRADFYVGDKVHDEKNSIKPIWVLDCISQQELLPMDDYILAINHKPKSCSSPEF
ncbi:hypothetical protein ACOMHN_011704 [Nucella lapillus]